MVDGVTPWISELATAWPRVWTTSRVSTVQCVANTLFLSLEQVFGEIRVLVRINLHLCWQEMYATRNATDSWSVGNAIFYDRGRQNKMAAPKASVHSVKNRLCYHFAVYPKNESCLQRYSRRIMMLRILIKILLASYSSIRYWGLNGYFTV